MRKLALVTAVLLPFLQAPAFADITFTGTNGGTVEKSRDCARAEGQANCTADTTYTGADGQTATKSRVRTTVPGSSSTEITLTGPEGETKTRKRLLTWGN